MEKVNRQADAKTDRALSPEERRRVEERSAPRAVVVHEVVRREGEKEMDRPVSALAWSGLAAGLSMGFSMIGEGLLQAGLPDASWRKLVTSFGYSLGFLIVILGRQQLFTESTITVVLPVLKDFTWHNLFNMARLWAIVLAANLAGTLFAALFCSFTPVVPDKLFEGMMSISRVLLDYGWWDMLFRGVTSGFLMAALVWMIPTAEALKFHVITLMTWLIAVGGFTHIVAGSLEAWLLVLSGDWSLAWMLWEFMVPVLIGNMIGGTALFAMISYAQVMEEI
jgi:formate/nitrite transporter FocA (FNT family)